YEVAAYSPRRSRRRCIASASIAAPSASLRRSFTYARCVLYGSVTGFAGGFMGSRPAGCPQRGQSQMAGATTSAAKARSLRWPLPHQYVTFRRGTTSMRSAVVSTHRTGLDPTLVPRMALPLATAFRSWCPGGKTQAKLGGVVVLAMNEALGARWPSVSLGPDRRTRKSGVDTQFRFDRPRSPNFAGADPHAQSAHAPTDDGTHRNGPDVEMLSNVA